MTQPTSSLIQILRSSADIPLADAGQIAVAIGPAPSLRGMDFALHDEQVESGIWECEPGSFRRHVAAAEVMHLLVGRCNFTPDGREPIEMAAGDSFYFPANTQGTWVITTTVRKLYVII